MHVCHARRAARGAHDACICARKHGPTQKQASAPTVATTSITHLNGLTATAGDLATRGPNFMRRTMHADAQPPLPAVCAHCQPRVQSLHSLGSGPRVSPKGQA